MPSKNNSEEESAAEPAEEILAEEGKKGKKEKKSKKDKKASKQDKKKASSAETAPILGSGELAAEDERFSAYKGDDERHCTDISFLILFSVYWIGMFIVAAISFMSGEPERLLYAVSHDGVLCGTEQYLDKKRVYYPKLQEDLIDAYMNHGDLYDPSRGGDPMKIPFYGVCVKKCPKQLEVLSVEDKKYLVNMNTTDVFFRCLPFYNVQHTMLIQCGTCKAGENCRDSCSSAIKGFLPANATCMDAKIPCSSGPDCEFQLALNIPQCLTAIKYENTVTEKGARSDPIFDSLNTGTAVITRMVGDLEMAAPGVLVSGGIIAVVMGLTWLFALQKFAGCMVWFTIFAVLLVLLLVTLFMAYMAGAITVDDVMGAVQDSAPEGVTVDAAIDPAEYGVMSSAADGQKNAYEFGMYLFLTIDVIFLCLLVFMWKNIQIAVEIIRISSKALRQMPALLLFPMIPCMLAVIMTLYWVVVAGYIASAGTINTGGALDAAAGGVSSLTDGELALEPSAVINQTATWEQNSAMEYMLVYHLFGLLWTFQLISAFAVCVIAGAVAEYYWAADQKKVNNYAVLHSLKRTLRYHCGSLAFGAFIIALIQLARIALEYIDRKTSRLQARNRLLRIAMMSLKCCMWCFEKCIKYISRNGYIIIAMKGLPFCSSVIESFKILLKNISKIATVNLIATFLLGLGKLTIVASCTAFMFMMIEYPTSLMPTFFIDTSELQNMSNPILPLLLTIMLSFGVTTYIFEVYQMTIDTILLSFCEDLAINAKVEQKNPELNKVRWPSLQPFTARCLLYALLVRKTIVPHASCFFLHMHASSTSCLPR
jgi:choline transporter-like protein 2/4/5